MIGKKQLNIAQNGAKFEEAVVIYLMMKLTLQTSSWIAKIKKLEPVKNFAVGQKELSGSKLLKMDMV